MKKMFFYAAIASVAFASCSKDKGQIMNPEESADKQPIQFVMGSAIEVTTRGTGAVGDLEGDKNVWRGEKLNVFMFEKNTLDLAWDLTTDEAYFDNLELIALTSGEGLYDDGKNKYYPGNGNFDFFAYHADDAVEEGYNTYENQYTVDFTIDGTQDLMVAKAEMNQQDKDDYDVKSDGKDPNYERVYSAYSARRNINPRFQFEHLLTRLRFHVVGAEPSVDDEKYGVDIDSVVIRNTSSKGEMVVAYVGEKPDSIITWGEDKADFWLTQRDEIEGEDVQQTKKLESMRTPAFGETKTLGESMLLCPSDSYELVVYYSQVPDKDVEAEGLEVVSFYPQTLTLEGGRPFEAGKQYNVYFKVYKAQPIQIQLELAPWVEDGDINVDSEEAFEEKELY